MVYRQNHQGKISTIYSRTREKLHCETTETPLGEAAGTAVPHRACFQLTGFVLKKKNSWRCHLKTSPDSRLITAIVRARVRTEPCLCIDISLHSCSKCLCEGCDLRTSSFTGSPADRADLEIGDEILEVNGRSLSNCSHTEVISHIHQASIRTFPLFLRIQLGRHLTLRRFIPVFAQCIRSRTICLRVKRKSGNRLGEVSSTFVHVYTFLIIIIFFPILRHLRSFACATC
jgi:hypothetical protein